MSDKELNTENENGGVDKKRRSLTKIGLTTPVIASLLSRPAIATQCSGSALASGNLSNQVELSTCGACDSVQWTNATPAELESISIDITKDVSTLTLFIIPSFTTSSAGSSSSTSKDPKKPTSKRPTNNTETITTTAVSSLPIITGTIAEALNGLIKINNAFTAVNPDETITATEQLVEAFKQFVTAYLNASHIATSINFPTREAVVRDVNDALAIITNNGSTFSLDMTKINNFKVTYEKANSSDSCAINYNKTL